MPPKRTNQFKHEWLLIEKYKPWLAEHKSSLVHAVCLTCKTDFHLGSIKLGAIESHSTGACEVPLPN